MARLKAIGPIAPTAAARVPGIPKTADEHYSTPAHRAWRAQVIARAGGRCEGLGCGAVGVRLYADHRIELKDGGAPLDLENGQALCASCHTTKTAQARAARQRR